AGSNIKYSFDPGTGAANIEPLTAKPVSFFGGGHVGCEYQMSSLVAGIEGTWSGMNLAETTNGLTVPSRSRTVNIEQIGTATGRPQFGSAPSRTTVSLAASNVPSGFFTALMETLTPGLSSLLLDNSYRVIRVSGVTMSFFSPSLYFTVTVRPLTLVTGLPASP